MKTLLLDATALGPAGSRVIQEAAGVAAKTPAQLSPA
jgi:hypothetical protein